LVVITDTQRASVEALLSQLERLARAAVPGSLQVQLRDLQLPIRERQRLGERLRQLTFRHEQLFSVNDRLDLAVLLAADGVHLSHSSVTPEDARAFGLLHGHSWHVSAACHAPGDFATSTADGLLLSPVIERRKGRPPLGLDGLAQAKRACRERDSALRRCWLYALGGVTRHNARELLDAGADGVALIGEVFEPAAPDSLLRALGIQR
jgi:thiamine-phosphate pyrophosphorylase